MTRNKQQSGCFPGTFCRGHGERKAWTLSGALPSLTGLGTQRSRSRNGAGRGWHPARLGGRLTGPRTLPAAVQLRLTLGEVVITQGTLPAQAPEGNVPRTPFPAPWSPSQLSPPWALAPCKCRSWSQQPLGPSGAETSLLCNPISGDMGSSEHRGAAGRGQRAPPSSEAPTTCPAM